MELKLFFRTLRRRWYLIVIPIVLVGAWIGFDIATEAPATTGYTTVVRFSAAQALDAIPNRDGDFQDVWLSSELTVRALTSWAQTTSFKREVAARTETEGVVFEPAQLPVRADHERSVGQLFLSWNDPEELAIIAEAALAVLREDSQRYFPQFGSEPAQVTVLDDIIVSPVPLPIEDRFGAIVQMGLAVIAGFGLAFVAEYLDPTLRSQDELEALGFQVVASVPRD